MAYLPRLPGRPSLVGLGVMAVLVAQAACTDAPTVPAALHWIADGEEWVAILPPSHLPEAAAWSPFAGPDTAREPLAGRIAELEAGASAALARGDARAAAATRDEIVALLERSLTRVPDAALLVDAGDAIDLWTERVQARVALDDAGALRRAVDSVAGARLRAARALEAGDSLAAARSLIAAGERIRAWSPSIVALRALERAEERMDALPATRSDVVRARHLVDSARRALADGDPMHALQGAVYALQIASGQSLLDPLAPAD